MNFLSDSERLEIDDMYSASFLTFCEPIVMYKNPNITYINEKPDYNFFYNEMQPGVESTYIPQVFSGSGTIEFLDDRDNQQLDNFSPNQPVVLPKGYVRLSISGSGNARDFLKGSEKIVFDGENYKLVSDLLYRGVFRRDFTDVFLQRFENPL